MAELRDSYKFSNVNELEFAVGRAIRTMGPEIVLNAIPLQVWEIYLIYSVSRYKCSTYCIWRTGWSLYNFLLGIDIL
jgi:hypothetical protein